MGIGIGIAIGLKPQVPSGPPNVEGNELKDTDGNFLMDTDGNLLTDTTT